MLFHGWVASFCLKKKQRWPRAGKTCSDSGRHIGQALKTEGKNEGVRSGELSLSPLSVHLALHLTGLLFIVTRKAGDTGDCSLGMGPNPCLLPLGCQPEPWKLLLRVAQNLHLVAVSFSAGKGGSGTVGV